MSERIIRIVWTPDLTGLHPEARATVTDESPPLPNVDPERLIDLVTVVRQGLGIRLRDVNRDAAQPGELAAYTVRHGDSGAPGRLTVHEAAS